ncbi:MAG: hypothetical protein JSW70_05750, partial [Syntrophobacterales bacterium]
IMGRKKVAENTEIAHFRIDAQDKKILERQAKKIGKKLKFSDLARDAIKEYIANLQREEAINRLRHEWKEFVELYDCVKDFGDKPFDFMLLVQAKERIKVLLEYIVTDFENYRSASPPNLPDFFQPTSPLPQDEVLKDFNIITRTLAEQYRKSIFDVFHILLSYIAWTRDWKRELKQFMDLLSEVVKKMESSMKAKEIPLPDINGKGNDNKYKKGGDD